MVEFFISRDKNACTLCIYSDKKDNKLPDTTLSRFFGHTKRTPIFSTTSMTVGKLFFDQFIPFVVEFITFFRECHRVTHSRRSNSDELKDPFSSERRLCITLHWQYNAIYKKLYHSHWKMILSDLPHWELFVRVNAPPSLCQTKCIW
jgi:hypothetical protein